MTKNEATKQTSFMDATTIPVETTYQQFKPAVTIGWVFRMLLTSEEKTARQTFFGKTEAEQAKARHAYNVTLLSGLAEEKPTGFPADFDELLSKTTGDTDKEKLQKAIYNYLIEPKPMSVRIADDATNLYSQYSQPLEFFR